MSLISSLDFKKIFFRLKHRNIILYGLNNTSISIIKNNRNFNFLGIDYKEKKKIKDIKKVNIEKNLNLKPIVIITTKSESAKIIFIELKSKFKKKIEIFFLDGSRELSKMNYDRLNYNYTDLEKLKKVVLKYSVVSFDLFDTLLNRNCSKPRDLIDFLSKDKHFLKYKNFAELRLLTQSKLEKDGRSFEIKEIYNSLNKKLKLPESKINKLIKYELEYEKKFTVINKNIKKVFDLCCKKKKKIFITTDFHFSKKQIKEILNFHKIFGYKDIISSCDYGFFKSNGKLFKILKKKNKKEKIIHIGDNFKSDILGAKIEKIRSYKISTPRDLILNSNIQDIYGNIKNDNDKVCAGLIQNKLYEFSNKNLSMSKYYKSFKISLEDFGYIFIGNTVYEYLQWINHEIEQKKISNIFFASREGYFLSKIYSKFFNYNEKNVKYFRSSRFLADNVSFKNMRDIIDSFKKHRYLGNLRNLLLNRFEIVINKNDSHKNLIINTKRDLKILSKLLKNYLSEILKNSKKWRTKYLEYISNSKNNSNKIALCDISLFSTLQRSLNKICKNNYYGFYIPTQINYKESNKIKFMEIDERFEKNYFILESILTAPHGCFRYITQKNKFAYQKKMNNQKFFKNRIQIIKGVEKYIKDILNLTSENKKSKKKFRFGKINSYLFSQFKNQIFDFDEKLFQSLYFDNSYVRVNENKIRI